MKINEKILSLPPYISTSWNHISSIVMKASQISITLIDGDTINIPGLEKDVIDLIFKTHAEHIESTYLQDSIIKSHFQDHDSKLPSLLSHSIFPEGQIPEPLIKFGFGTLDGLNTVMQHNPSEMDAPDLPQVVLQKIGSIAKILAPEDSALLPKEVPNCNCFYCQITRAININMDADIEVFLNDPTMISKTEEETEELVSDLDLQFNQWDVHPSGEKLYEVTNKLDLTEKFTVFLGSPVGCNCGEPNCEHIIAALRT